MRLKLIKPNGKLLGFILESEGRYDEEWQDFIRLLPRALESGEGGIEIEKNQIKVKNSDRWWMIFEINEEDAATIKQHIETQKMLWVRTGGYPIDIELTFDKRFAGCEPCELKTTN